MEHSEMREISAKQNKAKPNIAATKQRVNVEKERHETQLALVLMVIYIQINGSNSLRRA